MDKYLEIFIDQNYPNFIDKYLTTKTLNRLKHVTQFCGCDYTKIYSPLFLYTRFDHSLVVAHMTWHFTHDKKETIVALFHDVGTPCFAHCIDYVFGDYLNQESSEKSILKIIEQDEELLKFLESDGITLKDFENYPNFHILENKSPRLCTDRLDGVLHTCYVWLHTNSLEEIREVYDDLIVLENEEKLPEIGFKDLQIAEKFAKMVSNYALELQGDEDKYTMKYISEIVKLAFSKGLISLEDLYTKREEDICALFATNFSSWRKFNEATKIVRSDIGPEGTFYASIESKKRNTIPLVKTPKGNERVTSISRLARDIYRYIDKYKDSKYAYIKEIKTLK